MILLRAVAFTLVAGVVVLASTVGYGWAIAWLVVLGIALWASGDRDGDRMPKGLVKTTAPPA
jgi:hypothetical protein